jgi:HD superfamily phosphodiesterase
MKEDPWRLRILGREVAIEFMRKKKKLATSAIERSAWNAIIDLENQKLEAAKNKDQDSWDYFNTIKTPYEDMKYLKEAAE